MPLWQDSWIKFGSRCMTINCQTSKSKGWPICIIALMKGVERHLGWIESNPAEPGLLA